MKKSETKLVLYVFVALMLCAIFSGVVSAEEVSEDLNSLSSEIDRFLDTNKPVFVFFYAKGCYPCQQQKSIMDELEREYADKVAFFRVNGDENTEATNVFSVTEFPAMFLITSKVANSYNYQYFTGFKEKEELENSLECATLNTGLPEKSSSIQIMSFALASNDQCYKCDCARRAAAIASSRSYFTEGAFLSMDVCGESVSKWGAKLGCYNDPASLAPFEDNLGRCMFYRIDAAGWCDCNDEDPCTIKDYCKPSGICKGEPKCKGTWWNPCRIVWCENGNCKSKLKDCQLSDDPCVIWGRWAISGFCICDYYRRPGCDGPDDNFDVSTDTSTYVEPNSDSKLAILANGFGFYFAEVLNEFNLSYSFESIDSFNFSNYPVLVIPSGGLYGLSSSSTFKSNLEQYVKNGGTLIVFSQQHGYEFNLLPGGEVGGYGWLEDQSCQYRSVTVSTYHPILSGQGSTICTVNADGYFTKWPENATILLTRTKNSMPAMLMYEYGNGRVFATTLYDDWAYSNHAGTQDGTRLIRDTITWAMDQKEIPEYGTGEPFSVPIEITHTPSAQYPNYNPGEIVNIPMDVAYSNYLDLFPNYNPGDIVNIPINITNNGNTTSDKICFEVWNPELTMIDEMTIPTSISPSETKVINFSYTLPASSKHGRWFYTCSLLDTNDTLIQEEGGIFTVGNVTNLIADKIVFEIVGPLGPESTLVDYVNISSFLSPNEIKTVNFTYTSSTAAKEGSYLIYYRLFSNSIELGGDYGGEFTIRDLAHACADKVIFTVRDPDNNIVDHVNISTAIRPNETKTIDFSYTAPSKLGIWAIDYTLLNNSNVTQTAYDVQRFAVSKYAENPEGFVYQGKKITFAVNSESENYAYGSNGTFTIQIWNHGDADKAVTCWWSFPHNYWAKHDPIFGSPGTTRPGHSSNLYKTLTVPAHDEASFTYSVPIYSFDRLWADFYEGDDSSYELLGQATRAFYCFQPSLDVQIETERQEYAKGETVSVLLNLTNNQSAASNAIVTVRALDSGNNKVFEDTFNVNIGAYGTQTKTLLFSVPLTSEYGTCLVAVAVNENGNKIGSGSTYFKVPRDYIVKMNFDKPDKTYRIREDMDMVMEVTNIGSMLRESTVDLYIPDLAYEDTKSVSLNPNETETINYNLKIPETTSAGKHDVFVTIGFDNAVKQFYFVIPDSKLVLSSGRTNYNAGENLSVIITNVGGVDTSSNCAVTFYDFHGLKIYESDTEKSIVSGGTSALTFTIPEQAVSRKYYLMAWCKDQNTNMITRFSKSYSISGLKASLTSVTDKRVYSHNENVSIQTGITNLDGAIVAGKLNLKLVRPYEHHNSTPTRSMLESNANQMPSPSVLEIPAGTGINFNHKMPINVSSQALGIAISGVKDSDKIASMGAVSSASLSSNTIYVPDDYEKIQWAVDNASAGDTIIVRDGTYTENVDISKSHLTIQSENGAAKTIVRAANSGDSVFAVTHKGYVIISGFTVEGATSGYLTGGISLLASHCHISDNIATNNEYGIILSSSHGNSLTNNIMSDNSYNLGVSGYDLYHYIQDIGTTNKVDGKTVYYWVNQQDKQIPDDAGYVAVINSTNITVKDLVLTNNREGVLFAYTSDSKIENINASNTNYGILLYSASNNELTSNTANSNNYCGIRLYSASNNSILGNTASNNDLLGGISLSSSSNNGISGNTATNNSQGIFLSSSSNNSILGNTVSNNDVGISLSSSSNNGISDNIAYNNLYYGISLAYSSDNTISGNTVSNGNVGISLTFFSDNNLIYNNYFDNTNNACDEGNNTWNITKTPGVNIVGGPWLGGNYWSDYMGEDLDGDRLGDTLLPYNGSGKFLYIGGSILRIYNGGDYLPLLHRELYLGGTIWEINITVNMAVNETMNIVTDVPVNVLRDETGKIELIATLCSNTTQIINHTDYSFYIADKTTALILETDKSIYKPNETVAIYGEVHNNAENHDDYHVSIKKRGEEIFADSFSLDPGQVHSFTTSTSSETSFTIEGTVDGITVTDFVSVEKPDVNVSVIAPDVVGTSPFEVSILIENVGNIDADLNVSMGNKTWDITIPERELQLLVTTMKINENTTLNVIISGDVDITIKKEIICGGNAKINMTQDSTYLEGTVEIPFTIVNTGMMDSKFNATFFVPSTDNRRITKLFFVPEGEKINDSVSFNLTKGAYLLRYTSPFEDVNETINVLSAPEFVVSAMHPAEMDFTIRENVTLAFKVENIGGSEGEATLSLFMPDFEGTNRTWIRPGAVENICFNFAIPDDLEEKSYKGTYELDGKRGKFVYFVYGVNITVNASQDKAYYEENETTVLTLDVKNNRNMDLNLFSRVKFNGYDNTTHFSLSGLESKTLTFYVPVTFGRDNKMLYTVYADSGRSLYINSLYVYEENPATSGIDMHTDKQVYNIGEEVKVFADVTKTGNLRLSAPKYSVNTIISAPATFEFTLPELRSGTYYIEYTFENFSSAYPFDVIGYSARIPEANVDKGIYYNGDALKLKMNFEVNRNVSGLLKTRLYDPEDELIDEFAVNKSLVKGENEIEVCRIISTSISGMHEIVYSFYANLSLSGHNLTTLASGAEYFDVEAMATTPPTITFVPPTPANHSEVTVNYVFINISLNERAERAILNWDSIDYPMEGSETNFYKNMVELSNGTYTYKVYARDISGISGVSETRVVTILKSAPSEGEWNRTFGGPSDTAKSVRQTADGGYVVAGGTGSHGGDFWLVKTDANGTEQWNSTFGGHRHECAESVQQTSDGGYILTGCTISFGAGGNDFWLLKTDANGTEQWNRTFGGSMDDFAKSVRQTSDGGYILAGFTSSGGGGATDFWLLKTDANGTKQWDRTFGDYYWDEAYSVQQTVDGGYILAGFTSSGGGGATDFWLLKTDANGTKQWDSTFGGRSNDWAYSVQQTVDGGYILAGFTLSFGAGKNDFWLLKTNANGTKQWDSIFGGMEDDVAYSVQQTVDGGYILAGKTASYGAGAHDSWLVKTDANGTEQWNKTFGGLKFDSIYSVQQTADYGYILAGQTDSYGAGDFWLIKVSP